MNAPTIEGKPKRLRSERQARLRSAVLSYGTLVGLVGLMVVFGVLRTGVFLSAPNLRNILEQVAILGIISFSQTVVMVVGDFDLSVGSLASLSGVLMATLLIADVPLPGVLAATVVLGLVAGCINGLLVAYVGLSAFVATLAMMTSFGGLALYVTQGSTLFELPSSFLFLGQGRIGPIPFAIVVLIAVALLMWFALAHTTLGRRWYAIGGNREAMRLAGVNVDLTRFGAFLVTGVGASFAGLLLTSRLASAHPTAGTPFMLMSIAAVFLGMTLSKQGQPNIPGTAVGVLIFGVLQNGLNILQVSSYVQQILTGVIIVLAVSLAGLAQRARR